MCWCFAAGCQGLKLFSDATWAFEKGQTVEPNNKSWAVQLAKVSQLTNHQTLTPLLHLFTRGVVAALPLRDIIIPFNKI